MQVWTVDLGSDLAGVRVISHTLGEPWFVLAATRLEDRSTLRSLLFSLATQLSQALNRGVQPDWLPELHRIDEVLAVHTSGYELIVRGPLGLKQRFYDQQDNSPESADKRARLMDQLFLTKTLKEV